MHHQPPTQPRSRWLTALNRVGQRVGWVMSAIILTVVYYAALGPFSLLAGRWKLGWQPSTALDLETQF